ALSRVTLEEDVAPGDWRAGLQLIDALRLPIAQEAVDEPGPAIAPMTPTAERQLPDPARHETVRPVIAGDALLQLGVARVEQADAFAVPRPCVGREQGVAAAEAFLDAELRRVVIRTPIEAFSDDVAEGWEQVKKRAQADGRVVTQTGAGRSDPPERVGHAFTKQPNNRIVAHRAC